MEQQTEKFTEMDNGEFKNSTPVMSSTVALLFKINPDHKLVHEYQKQYEKYLENLKNQSESFERKKPEIILPELRPMDVESLYETFKTAFHYFIGKPFDENVNSGESRKLARTLCAYFISKKAFLKSPLINSKISVPSLEKGIMIIGGKGVGKTAIMKTFNEMFYYSLNHPITVNDIEGTNQFLGRYKLNFSFHTANEVVENFEYCSDENDKRVFNEKFAAGFRYFDDVMSENIGSNYGKFEVFKTILENRYTKKSKTIISVNYHDEEDGKQKDVSKTLNAFGNRYGDRVFDRIFEMFNVIELTGNSLRR